MITNITDYENCLAAQMILHEACKRAHEEMEREHAICAQAIGTLHFIRFFRAARAFRRGRESFRRLNRAFQYLVKQNIERLV